MGETLKPCPFCGGTAKLFKGQCAEDAEFASVQCSQCFVSTETFEDAYAPSGQATAAWNNRTVPEPPVPSPVEGGDLEKRGLTQGLLLACTTIIRTFDRPEIAAEILRDAGLTAAEIKNSGLNEFDTAPALRILAEEAARRDTASMTAPTLPAPVAEGEDTAMLRERLIDAVDYASSGKLMRHTLEDIADAIIATLLAGGGAAPRIAAQGVPEELKTLSDAAPAGPWGHGDEAGDVCGYLEPDEFRPVAHCSGAFCDWESSADLIIAAVNHLRYQIERERRARRETGRQS